MASTPLTEESLAALARQVADDAARLVHLEIALAKAQAAEAAKRVLIGSGLLAAAGLLLLFGVIYAFAAFPVKFGADLHDAWVGWAGFGFVWLFGAALCAALGVRRLIRAMREAKATLAAMKEDVEWAKQLPRHDGRLT